jgi:hypothetical protein
MKGEAWAWKFKNETLLFYLFSSLFFEVLPIAQQIIRYLMGIGFSFERLGNESRTNGKRNLWHGQSYNILTAEIYNEIFVCFVIKTFLFVQI